MISAPDREEAVSLINEAVGSGARKTRACAEVGITARTLDQLTHSGCILGIVTGRPAVEARWPLDRLGWKRYFPLVVAKEKHERRGKPDPFALQHALGIHNAAGLNVKPDSTVHIGDSVDDMQAARTAGMWGIGMVPQYLDPKAHAQLLRDRGAHIVIHDPDTLPELIDTFSQRVALEAKGQQKG